MPRPLLVTFVAGATGPWCITRMTAVIGEPLPAAQRLAMIEESATAPASAWVLRGVTSNTRYTTRAETAALAARQQGLGRTQATCAVLIPIRKSEAWWSLAQDERRAVIEERSRHVTIGLDYLPAVARRLHHSRDLVTDGHVEPFDFLTWFEFAPEHEGAFDEMLARLRATEEWRFVEREAEVRLWRDA